MKTDVYTPMTVFHLPQRLVVPFFQRPYVWTEDDQWAPLWQDIRRTAELRLSSPGSIASHFLGAVVLQAGEQQHGHLQTSNIIDGQQRVTTLQLLMDAVALVLESAGQDNLAAQLDMLTHNQSTFVAEGKSRLKLRHTNRDRAAFDEVMEADPPVEYTTLNHANSLVTKAHEYFANAAQAWLGDEADAHFSVRTDALVSALTQGIQLVVINLGSEENSQEIFETLNARGTPLTAADLIKNFVFQRLALEGVDTKRAYGNDWIFDTKFWETGVSVGRFIVSRSSLFLNQWLISRTGEEISPNSTFSRFKAYVEHEAGEQMVTLLRSIKKQAQRYEHWTAAANDPDRHLTPVDMAVYRMQANGIELLKPLLIWLHSPEKNVPEHIVNEVVAMAESWVIRRQLLRLPNGDLGRVVAEVIRIHREAVPNELPALVMAYLSRLNVLSTYWPGDAEVRDALATDPVYRRFTRARLRMILEAIENNYRAQTNQPQVPRRSFPVEHVLPQKWETNWPVQGLEAEQSRTAHIHRLGNLTLLTNPLNSKVSNGPWEAKVAAFDHHNTLLITSRLLQKSKNDSWDERFIDQRSRELAEDVLRIWPAPLGHTGQVIDPQVKEPDWLEVKDLVGAGVLQPGTVLSARPGKWTDAKAVIRGDGLIELDGKTFDTPSGAGKYLRGGSTNGWYFWRLSDGRTLKDVRAAYRAAEARATAASTIGGAE